MVRGVAGAIGHGPNQEFRHDGHTSPQGLQGRVRQDGTAGRRARRQGADLDHARRQLRGRGVGGRAGRRTRARRQPRGVHGHSASGQRRRHHRSGRHDRSTPRRIPSPSFLPDRAGSPSTAKGLIARIFSKASEDIIAQAWNNATYADGAPELAPPDLWPAPYDGYRLRHYPLAQYAKPDGDRIQPRVFRSTNMLVNLFVHYKTRRDTTKLSPHWHDDFEQASLTLNGRWVHHMRYNWGPDLSTWQPDDHGEMGTPSVIIIPGHRRPHEPRRRRRRDVALRHLLPAPPGLRPQERLRDQRGRVPASRRAGGRQGQDGRQPALLAEAGLTRVGATDCPERVRAGAASARDAAPGA